ncbi:MAG: DUF2007 domain-containing protein [Bdellovibrionales bacterium]|nr:DUF2007 domain-containing protein [Bdellovibrionales bacterium]NQZ17658.1 DUF2007 domain-containing protein [Bdellovibrionales bacterium]
MKVVKEFESRMDAQIAKGFLESSGIKAVVAGDDEGGFNPAMSMTFGVKVLVADVDYEKAIEILEAIDKAPPILEVVPDSED